MRFCALCNFHVNGQLLVGFDTGDDNDPQLGLGSSKHPDDASGTTGGLGLGMTPAGEDNGGLAMLQLVAGAMAVLTACAMAFFFFRKSQKQTQKKIVIFVIM